MPSQGGFGSEWGLAYGELHMPDRIVWALLAVSVFSKVNKGEKTTGSYYLSFGNERFTISEWWGREDVVLQQNTIKYELSWTNWSA
jgi:hypothetical protein